MPEFTETHTVEEMILLPDGSVKIRWRNQILKAGVVVAENTPAEIREPKDNTDFSDLDADFAAAAALIQTPERKEAFAAKVKK